MLGSTGHVAALVVEFRGELLRRRRGDGNAEIVARISIASGEASDVSEQRLPPVATVSVAFEVTLIMDTDMSSSLSAGYVGTERRQLSTSSEISLSASVIALSVSRLLLRWRRRKPLTGRAGGAPNDLLAYSSSSDPAPGGVPGATLPAGALLCARDLLKLLRLSEAFPVAERRLILSQPCDALEFLPSHPVPVDASSG